MALLLLCLGGTVRVFIIQFSGHTVLQSIGAQGLPAVLIWQLVGFAGALILVHALTGAAALLLTAATEAAQPQLTTSRQGLVFLWFIAAMIWVVAANAAWFPHSQYADHYGVVAAVQVGPWSLFEVYSVLLSTGVAAVLVTAAIRPGLRLRNRRAVLGSAITMLAIAAPIAFAKLDARASLPVGTRPNVVLLGIDSLRLEQLREFGGSGLTPNLDDFLKGAVVFHDAITPESRTFSSWASILTGRHPGHSGAVFNLTPRRLVDASRSIGHRLQEAGYRTIFAIDEARFANFDQSYGFDQVVTPPIGARDFLIGSLSDLPLANLIANGPGGRWLFPDLTANRGIAVSYRANAFTERLERDVEFRQPSLLAAHLTLPHWPYYSADNARAQPEVAAADAKIQLYQSAVRDADRQFGQILALLKARGVLDNALVVALSDHGEAMSHLDQGLIGEDNDAEVRRRAVAYTQGHGTSVLTEAQFRVLLAFRRYGQAEIALRPGPSHVPASLEDILPTVLQMLELPADPRLDGQSLLPILQRESDAERAFDGRIRFTETDFNVPRMLAGDINIKWLAMQSIDYYRIVPENGWVEFREEKLPEMMAVKERAAIQGEWLMAALPKTDKRTTYVLVNRKTRKARMISDAAPADPQAAVLLQALREQYAGYLTAPAL